MQSKHKVYFFILFVNKEDLSHINPAFVAMSLYRHHVWDLVNIVYSWHYWSQNVVMCNISPNGCRPLKCGTLCIQILMFC